MVSIILPTLDEGLRLPACLGALVEQARDCAAEVLVVDGGSTDETVAIARSFNVRVLSSERGRGVQMNRGAREARGSLLVFLAADTLVPPGWVRGLSAIDRTGSPRAGGSPQRFDSPSAFLSIVSRISNLRASLTGVIYGDQSPFIRRDLFIELGGYREDMHMEDVEFATRLRRRCRPHLLKTRTTTSSRRFDQVGAFRATIEAAYLLACWTLFRRVPRSRTFFTPIR